jgi:KTSC domain-containing protein
MVRVDFESTILAWARYLPDARRLQVGLCTGKTYDYFDVPADIYQDLLAAESKGRYFNRHIRNAFRYQKVSSFSTG